jgi:hypothetical protein
MSYHASDHEASKQALNFRGELENALAHVLPHTLDDPLKIEGVASRYADKPDSYVINLPHIPRENQVSTTDASQYFSLLTQAAEIISGGDELTEEDIAWLHEAAYHELVHDSAVEPFGNSNTVHHLGVEFVMQADGKAMLWPYHSITGPLKKVHRAWSAAAPEDRSDTDMAEVTGLGYSDDIEELRARAIAEPPVDESVQGPSVRNWLIDSIDSTD